MLFLYKETTSYFQLYVGEINTVECLRHFSNEADVSDLQLGASLYQDLGWATEEDIPEMRTVRELIQFFEREGEIGLIDFSVEIDGIGNLSTHDDSEADIRFINRDSCLNFLKRLDIPFVNKLINELMSHQGNLY